MSPTQGWFESDEDYSRRVALEADERTIEQSSGSGPSKGWFENDDDYRTRISNEANESRIKDSSGEAPSRGWFESEESYSVRISREANERTIQDHSGSAPSRGLFESETEYDTRVRREANESVLEGANNDKPSQGWFEGDHAYRSRIAHEARVIRASETSANVGDRSRTGTSASSASGGASGGMGLIVLGALLIAGICWSLSLSRNDATLTAAPSVGGTARQTTLFGVRTGLMPGLYNRTDSSDGGRGARQIVCLSTSIVDDWGKLTAYFLSGDAPVCSITKVSGNSQTAEFEGFCGSGGNRATFSGEIRIRSPELASAKSVMVMGGRSTAPGFTDLNRIRDCQ